MRFLLDTHALLWFIGGDSRLSTRARAAIEDINNTRLFLFWQKALLHGRATVSAVQ
jgi:PIN domain nuclease of toxin-antitoxin system